jgi:hypothetical protein
LRVDVDTTDLALFDEEITKVQKMFMDVIHFVCSLKGKEAFASGDQNGITSSRDGAVGKQGRTETCKTEKRRSEGISDVIDVETSALQDIGGGSHHCWELPLKDIRERGALVAFFRGVCGISKIYLCKR